MQAYGDGFAQVYNLRWGGFAERVAPKLLAFYEATEIGRSDRRLLDICCGTGQLARYFLAQGYTLTGLDLSPAMLEHAIENNREFVDQGRARFLEADAADFELGQRFGLALATFDALNHLPDMTALAGCVASVYDVLAAGGWFIFDLNTRAGLRTWGGMSVQDYEDLVVIIRGIVAEHEGRAYTQISGFLRRESGLYARFDETVYNTIFDLDAVADVVRDAGFRTVTFASSDDLTTPLDAPKAQSRVFVVVQK
jgi:SAM-dependent methyltransferase